MGGGLDDETKPAPISVVRKSKKDAPGVARKGRSKFNEELRTELWEKHQNGEKPDDLAKHYGCNVNTIYNQIYKIKKERGGSAPAKKANLIKRGKPK